MAHWLAKSEPSTYSIDDLKREKVTSWDSIRNYQARNFMRSMQKGDLVLFYHSNADPPAVVGIAKVVKEAYPDPTQFDKKNAYYDPKATRENPRWFCPDLRFVKKFKAPVALNALREVKSLGKMQLLQRGSRLSVHPVTEREFSIISEMGS